MPNPRSWITLAASPLLEYFTSGTANTVTGASWGAEIETHFVDRMGHPISTAICSQILNGMHTGPWRVTTDLGRQLIELVILPQDSPKALGTTTLEGLRKLYTVAKRFGAHPVFQPRLSHTGNLLWVREHRDELWRQLDGQPALEHLTRTAAVQVITSVSQADAIRRINTL